MIIQKITGQPQRACSLPCPHCRAGADGKDLGLFWDFYEDAWRCIFCGYRSFEQIKQTSTRVLEDIIWDNVLATIEEEEKKERLYAKKGAPRRSFTKA